MVWPRRAGSRGRGLLDEEREGSGVAVEEIFVTHRAEFAVAEEPGEAQGAQLFLDMAGVVVGLAEQAPASPVATAEAAAVDAPAADLLFGQA